MYQNSEKRFGRENSPRRIGKRDWNERDYSQRDDHKKRRVRPNNVMFQGPGFGGNRPGGFNRNSQYYGPQRVQGNFRGGNMNQRFNPGPNFQRQGPFGYNQYPPSQNFGFNRTRGSRGRGSRRRGGNRPFHQRNRRYNNNDRRGYNNNRGSRGRRRISSPVKNRPPPLEINRRPPPPPQEELTPLSVGTPNFDIRQFPDEDSVKSPVEKLPTVEHIMGVIEKIDSDITLCESQLKDLEDEVQLPDKDESKEDEFDDKHKKEICKNFVEEIYFENHSKHVDSHVVFHNLLNTKNFLTEKTEPLKSVKSFDGILGLKEHNETFSKLQAQIEGEIKKEKEDLKKFYDGHIKKIKNLRKEWKERFKDESKGQPVSERRRQSIIPRSLIPRMLPRDQREEVFIDENGLVTDPKESYRLKRITHSSWTNQEVEVFFEKFYNYPKDLRKISTFLPNKTCGDVINYYYHVKHTPRFKKLMNGLKKRRKYRRRPFREGITIFSTPARGRGLGIMGNIVPRGLTDRTLWTQSETRDFVELLKRHGKDFQKIAKELVTKTAGQCKNFFSNNKRKMGMDKILQQNVYARNRDRERFWTTKEKKLFLKYFSKLGRNWGLIASKFKKKTILEVKEQFLERKYVLGLISREKLEEKRMRYRIWDRLLENGAVESNVDLENLTVLSGIVEKIGVPKFETVMKVDGREQTKLELLSEIALVQMKKEVAQKRKMMSNYPNNQDSQRFVPSINTLRSKNEYGMENISGDGRYGERGGGNFYPNPENNRGYGNRQFSEANNTENWSANLNSIDMINQMTTRTMGNLNQL